jgi:GNAT superfamily N-acetyltransferase
MIELRPAAKNDLPHIVELLGHANDIPYDLPRVAEEKCFGEGIGGSPQTILAWSGDTLLGIAVTCGKSLRILAVHKDHRRKSIGSILLREAERTIGTLQVVVGAEAGNYFIPGIPRDSEAMQRFFHLNGYMRLSDEAVDLTVSLANVPHVEDPRIRRGSAAERDEVVHFVEQNFARAWALETKRAFENREPTVFLARENGKLVGFSAHDANNRGLGFFGPEGILPEVRGHGIGKLLLLSSLADLRKRGFKNTIIAWAAAHGFYRRVCGAEIAHRFTMLRKVV